MLLHSLLDDLQMIIQHEEQEGLMLTEVNMTTMKNSVHNYNLLNSNADLDLSCPQKNNGLSHSLG